LLRNWIRHRNGLSRQHAKVLHHVKSIMHRVNRPGPTRLDAAGLYRYLLAGTERFSADDLTMLWQHQRRLVAIRCDAGFKKSWLRIAKTAGKKAAAVAIARKILVLMWTLVRKDELHTAREPVAACRLGDNGTSG
jgi:hypothetical protein